MNIEVTRRPAVSPIESVTLTLSEKQFRAILEMGNFHLTTTDPLRTRELRFGLSPDEIGLALMSIYSGIPMEIKEELKRR